MSIVSRVCALLLTLVCATALPAQGAPGPNPTAPFHAAGLQFPGHPVLQAYYALPGEVPAWSDAASAPVRSSPSASHSAMSPTATSTSAEPGSGGDSDPGTGVMVVSPAPGEHKAPRTSSSRLEGFHRRLPA